MQEYKIVSPGRVNLIGEHVDHQNYPVFPCAIEQSIEVQVVSYTREEAAAQQAPALAIFHEQSEYESVIFEKHEDIKIEKGAHHWYHYVIASYFGISEYIHNRRSVAKGHTIKRFEGLPAEYLKPENLVVDGLESPANRHYKLTVKRSPDGSVPKAAGLSSSSSLTCAASMAWDIKGLTPAELASVSAHGEGYSGTASGGMDQAAIMLSEEGKALKIDFHPLRHEAVALPPELAIVVANTGRLAPKAVSYAKMYNKRVFELKCACYLILHKFGKSLTNQELIVNGLRDVLEMVAVSETDFLEKHLDECLKKGCYTRKDLEECIPAELREFLLEKRCGPRVWEVNDDFWLYNRVRHVLTENERVLRFVEICKNEEKRRATSSAPTEESVLSELGKLLDGSFESLSGDFDCGCAELSALVKIEREAGAYGARLTGAGWGGCTVSLVHKDKLVPYMKQIADRYFKPLIDGTVQYDVGSDFIELAKEHPNQVLFATKPSRPARKC